MVCSYIFRVGTVIRDTWYDMIWAITRDMAYHVIWLISYHAWYDTLMGAECLSVIWYDMIWNHITWYNTWYDTWYDTCYVIRHAHVCLRCHIFWYTHYRHHIVPYSSGVCELWEISCYTIHVHQKIPHREQAAHNYYPSQSGLTHVNPDLFRNEIKIRSNYWKLPRHWYFQNIEYIEHAEYIEIPNLNQRIVTTHIIFFKRAMSMRRRP